MVLAGPAAAEEAGADGLGAAEDEAGAGAAEVAGAGAADVTGALGAADGVGVGLLHPLRIRAQMMARAASKTRILFT